MVLGEYLMHVVHGGDAVPMTLVVFMTFHVIVSPIGLVVMFKMDVHEI